MNYNIWNINISKKIASNENILLNSEHFRIIFYMRHFYKKYKVSPSINIFISFFNKKYNNKTLNLKYLNLIFKNKFKKIIYKISGLPNPVKCLI